LRAIFQIESGVNVDTGLNSTSAGTFATRNSNVGLSGGFGTVFFGNWDTPYKVTTATGPIDAFYGTGIANYANVISGNSTPTSTNAANRNAFDRRQNNSVQYWTPAIGGFSGRFAYSANEQRTSDGAPIPQNPNFYSAAGIYSSGPIYLSLAYEKHDEFANTALTRTSDKGVKFGAAYTFFDATTIGLIYEQLTFNGNIAATGLSKVIPTTFLTAAQLANAGEGKVQSYYVSLRHLIGPHTFRAMFGGDRGLKVDGSDVPSSKASTYAIGYSYSFSKRTDVYGTYAAIRNDSNSKNDFAIGGISGVNAGADPRGVSLGIRHVY
jgi:predicted porin